MSLSPVILAKKKTLCIIYLLVTRPNSCRIRWKGRQRERERETENGARDWKRATRNVISFGCVDEENKVWNWKTFRVTKFDSLKSCKLFSVRCWLQQKRKQDLTDYVCWNITSFPMNFTFPLNTFTIKVYSSV